MLTGNPENPNPAPDAPAPHIRPETPADRAAVAEVNRLAFGGEAEGRLVERLHADGLVVASLVAEDAGRVVGHILFSRLPLETARGDLPAASLAPMAVRPERQGRGIGAALVRAGLAACRERGCVAVVVLGHPGYYPRFGFSAALAAGLEAPWRGEALMALELVPGALAGRRGRLRYPAAFAEVG